MITRSLDFYPSFVNFGQMTVLLEKIPGLNRDTKIRAKVLLSRNLNQE